jgi:hypothetical protein
MHKLLQSPTLFMHIFIGHQKNACVFYTLGIKFLVCSLDSKLACYSTNSSTCNLILKNWLVGAWSINIFIYLIQINIFYILVGHDCKHDPKNYYYVIGLTCQFEFQFHHLLCCELYLLKHLFSSKKKSLILHFTMLRIGGAHWNTYTYR